MAHRANTYRAHVRQTKSPTPYFRAPHTTHHRRRRRSTWDPTSPSTRPRRARPVHVRTLCHAHSASKSAASPTIIRPLLHSSNDLTPHMFIFALESVLNPCATPQPKPNHCSKQAAKLNIFHYIINERRNTHDDTTSARVLWPTPSLAI